MFLLFASYMIWPVSVGILLKAAIGDERVVLGQYDMRPIISAIAVGTFTVTGFAMYLQHTSLRVVDFIPMAAVSLVCSMFTFEAAVLGHYRNYKLVMLKLVEHIRECDDILVSKNSITFFKNMDKVCSFTVDRTPSGYTSFRVVSPGRGTEILAGRDNILTRALSLRTMARLIEEFKRNHIPVTL
uniref:Uncharacterized protein n=1 Tax=Ochrobactrum phage ORM_20 TaxID=2985243 RepID=A0A9N6ZG47_9VIRU|nr:hypothetical protein ORM20_00233 [Ochrobactrum phage ORM_20]